MDIRVLGVAGSPRKGATHALVRAALLGAEDVGDVTTEYVSLAGKSISPCNGCEACLSRGGCVIDDDMQPMYAKLLWADAVILGTPVYFGSPSALCKAFMERVEAFGIHDKKLRLKVGGAIAVAGSRNGGQETAMIAINLWFHINEMLPIGSVNPVASWGATGTAGHGLEDINLDSFRLTTTNETIGAKEASWLYGRKVAVVAKIVKAGRMASGLDVLDSPYGWSNQKEYPPELYAMQ